MSESIHKPLHSFRQTPLYNRYDFVAFFDTDQNQHLNLNLKDIYVGMIIVAHVKKE